jgi:hypothetical protein
MSVGAQVFPLIGDWERALMYMHVDAFDMTKQQTDAEQAVLLTRVRSNLVYIKEKTWLLASL